MRAGPEHTGTTGATAGDGLVYDPDTDEYGPGPVVQGLISADTSVTITDNGDGTLDLAAAGGGGGGGSSLLAYKSYAAGTSASNSTTTLTDVDATNLAVTFTVPASGRVLIRLTAVVGGSGTQGLYWGLREGTTAIANNLIRSSVTNDNTSVAFVVTGLTPGTSHTYKWAQRVGGASTTVITYFGTSSTVAVMEVHALP